MVVERRGTEMSIDPVPFEVPDPGIDELLACRDELRTIPARETEDILFPASDHSIPIWFADEPLRMLPCIQRLGLGGQRGNPEAGDQAMRTAGLHIPAEAVLIA